jgi:hypothetical protein
MLVSECIKFRGRLYDPTEEAQEAICQLDWAYGVLEKENVTYQNGRQSHEVANETVEKYEDALISHQRFTA